MRSIYCFVFAEGSSPLWINSKQHKVVLTLHRVQPTTLHFFDIQVLEFVSCMFLTSVADFTSVTRAMCNKCQERLKMSVSALFIHSFSLRVWVRGFVMLCSHQRHSFHSLFTLQIHYLVIADSWGKEVERDAALSSWNQPLRASLPHPVHCNHRCHFHVRHCLLSFYCMEALKSNTTLVHRKSLL